MDFPRWLIPLAFCAPLGAVQSSAAESGQAAADEADAWYEAGKALFDQLAPPEVKHDWRFPTKDEWNQFASRLQSALDNNRLDELAAYEPEARTALATLSALPGSEEYVDWLRERIDYIEAASQAARLPPSRSEPPIPLYSLWLKRVRTRPVPAAAHDLLPDIQSIFSSAGLPPELAWLAEVESSFNPEARSPVGACGLFQLMPATAVELGLSPSGPDERTDPGKNARAAAKYLRELHDRFNDWPLALAAYNAGPGRVGRTLKKQNAKTFDAIAGDLPTETRMYVPKVLATLQVRAGVTPSDLESPRNPDTGADMESEADEPVASAPDS